MSVGGEYSDCESCGLKAWEPRVVEMQGSEMEGAKLCLSCRKACDTCRLTGSAEEDFADSDAKTCKHCVRAEHASEERFTAYHDGGIGTDDIQRRELREAGR